MQKKTDARLEMLALLLCDLWVVKGHWIKTVCVKTERSECSFASSMSTKGKVWLRNKIFLSPFFNPWKKILSEKK